MTNEIYNKLNLAVEKRNYLAHHFWYESAYDIYTVEGIEKCLKELDEIDNLFSTLDYEIVKMFDAHKSKLGISDEMLEQQMRLGIAGNIPPPAPTKPKLKKQIKIIQAYNVEVTSELVGMIFETDEGELLQFCDVGLGYSYLEKGKGKWVPNNKLTEHLPFQVNPRPKVTSAWNFELQIKKDTVLWVTRGSKDRTFRWGIRKDK